MPAPSLVFAVLLREVTVFNSRVAASVCLRLSCPIRVWCLNRAALLLCGDCVLRSEQRDGCSLFCC